MSTHYLSIRRRPPPTVTAPAPAAPEVDDDDDAPSQTPRQWPPLRQLPMERQFPVRRLSPTQKYSTVHRFTPVRRSASAQRLPPLGAQSPTPRITPLPTLSSVPRLTTEQRQSPAQASVQRRTPTHRISPTRRFSSSPFESVPASAMTSCQMMDANVETSRRPLTTSAGTLTMINAAGPLGVGGPAEGGSSRPNGGHRPVDLTPTRGGSPHGSSEYGGEGGTPLSAVASTLPSAAQIHGYKNYLHDGIGPTQPNSHNQFHPYISRDDRHLDARFAVARAAAVAASTSAASGSPMMQHPGSPAASVGPPHGYVGHNQRQLNSLATSGRVMVASGAPIHPHPPDHDYFLPSNAMGDNPHMEVPHPADLLHRGTSPCGHSGYWASRRSPQVDPLGGNGDWVTMATRFLNVSSCHGVKHFANPNMFVGRRVLWLVLFLLALIFSSLQLIDRVSLFLAPRLQTHLIISDQIPAKFPAVTFCNRNQFRLTQAFKMQKFNLLTELYNVTTPAESTLEVLQRHSNQFKLDRLYLEAAHKREDMILGCTIGGRPCYPSNFSLSVTEFGICYTFNAHLDRLATVHQTGQKSGLFVVLNTERYQYMPGPHSGIGVRVMLHDQIESKPDVASFGFDVSPGNHVSVGFKKQRTENIAPSSSGCKPTMPESDPGQRSSPELHPGRKFLGQNSRHICRQNCLMKYVVNLCKCKDLYMNGPVVQEAPICDIEKKFTCLEKAKELFDAEEMRKCACVEPCDVTSFTTRISNAILNPDDVASSVKSGQRARLIQSYLHAREVRERTDQVRKQNDKDMLSRMLRSYYAILRAVRQERPPIDDVTKRLNNTLNKFFGLFEDFLRRQHSILGRSAQDYNGIVGSRSSRQLTLNFVMDEISKEKMILQKDIAKKKSKLHWSKKEFRHVIDRTVKIMENLEDVRDLVNDMSIYYNKTLEDARKDELEFLESYRQKEIAEMKEVSWPIPYAFKKASIISEKTERITRDITITLRNKGTRRIEESHARFLKNPDNGGEIVLRELEMWSRNISSSLENHQRTIQDLLSEYKSIEDELSVDLGELGHTLDETQKTYLEIVRRLEGLHQLSSSKVDALKDELDYSLVNRTKSFMSQFVSKMELGRFVLSPNFVTLSERLEKFTEDILSDSLDIHQKLTEFQQQLEVLLQLFRKGSSSEPAVLLPETEKHLMQERFREWDSETWSGLQRLHKLTTTLESALPEVVASFAGVRAHFRDFVGGAQLNHEFYRRNFVTLDIYFERLETFNYSQYPAYNVFEFLSDVGGTLALFFGASIFTIYEIIDFLLLMLYRSAKDCGGDDDNEDGQEGNSEKTNGGSIGRE